MDIEHVLVVPTQLLHELGYFQGFQHEPAAYLRTLLDPRHASYHPRDRAEQDPSLKQLIPYVIFRYRDDAGREQLFQYVRGKGQGEQRLHSKLSVGIGGHISACDAAQADPYDVGMQRELDEEVSIETPYRQRCVGLINDDLTDVGRVHLGVVHLFDVERPEIYPREPDILEAGFQPLDQLLGRLEAMETWSKICLEALFAPQ